jgi:hypothetical protein
MVWKLLSRITIKHVRFFKISSSKGFKISIQYFGLMATSLILAAAFIWLRIRKTQKLQYAKQHAQFWEKVVPQNGAEHS